VKVNRRRWNPSGMSRLVRRGVLPSQRQGHLLCPACLRMTGLRQRKIPLRITRRKCHFRWMEAYRRARRTQVVFEESTHLTSTTLLPRQRRKHQGTRVADPFRVPLDESEEPGRRRQLRKPMNMPVTNKQPIPTAGCLAAEFLDHPPRHSPCLQIYAARSITMRIINVSSPPHGTDMTLTLEDSSVVKRRTISSSFEARRPP
jgi:hypothetical protein